MEGCFEECLEECLEEYFEKCFEVVLEAQFEEDMAACFGKFVCLYSIEQLKILFAEPVPLFLGLFQALRAA